MNPILLILIILVILAVVGLPSVAISHPWGYAPSGTITVIIIILLILLLAGKL